MDGREINQTIRQVGYVITMLATICLIVYQLSYFISAALGAFTIFMLLHNWHRKLIERGWSNLLSTITLVLLTIMVLFVVGGAVAGLVISKINDFQLGTLTDKVNAVHDFIMTKTGVDMFSKEMIDKSIRSASSLLPDIFATTGGILVNGFMMLVLLFFMLLGREQLEHAADYLPLRDDSIAMLRNEVTNMVVSNAIGIPIIVIGQAIVSGLGYWILGAGDPVVWGVLTGVMGLIPVIGSASVWLILAINLVAGGFVWQGVILVLYGALITSNVDNVIRMIMLKKYANVHPIVTLFGIILGMNLFGFWGIIFGPLIISGVFLLIKIYRNEFLIPSKSRSHEERMCEPPRKK